MIFKLEDHLIKGRLFPYFIHSLFIIFGCVISLSARPILYTWDESVSCRESFRSPLLLREVICEFTL